MPDFTFTVSGTAADEDAESDIRTDVVNLMQRLRTNHGDEITSANFRSDNHGSTDL